MARKLKVPVTKEMLEMALQNNPDATWGTLAELFGCGATTIGRLLTRFGMTTKKWTERTHSEETKKRLSDSRIESGVAKGANNPNFGDKPRPWLEGPDAPLKKWHREHPDFGALQRGDANPIHKVLDLYDDPAYVAQITRGLRQHVDKKRGSTYEEVYGDEKAAEYRQKLRDASPRRMAKFNRKETAPESIIRAVLIDIGAEFECQVPFGHHTVDFYVPAANLVLQADGDYWHGNPRFYGGLGKPLSALQKKVQRIDASCNSFLRNRGIKILRFWEHDLHNQLVECTQRIKEILNGGQKT